MSYTCTVSRTGVLYVYKVLDNGEKVRVKNVYASQCPKKQLKECSQLCSGKKVHPKVKPPCRRQKTVFANKKDIKKHCQVRTRGPYNVSQRQRIANEANALLKQEMAENATPLATPLLLSSPKKSSSKKILKPSIVYNKTAPKTKSIGFYENPTIMTFKPEVEYKKLKKPASRRSKFDLPPTYYSLNALKKMAREQGIKGYTKMTKQELCQVLNLHCQL